LKRRSISKDQDERRSNSVTPNKDWQKSRGCLKNNAKGLPCPLQGDLPNPGIEPTSLVSLTLVGGFFTTSATTM